MISYHEASTPRCDKTTNQRVPPLSSKQVLLKLRSSRSSWSTGDFSEFHTQITESLDL